VHGADQVAKLAASMAEFGWTVPCLVAEDGELIAGHGRVLAATQLGLTEAPVIVLGHLTEAQRRAYRIADNKLPNRHGTRRCCRPSCRTCWPTSSTCR
jgi:ParB-like chromosome segregation protein Spo0J